jgi:hypothetical protein
MVHTTTGDGQYYRCQWYGDDQYYRYQWYHEKRIRGKVQKNHVRTLIHSEADTNWIFQNHWMNSLHHILIDPPLHCFSHITSYTAQLIPQSRWTPQTRTVTVFDVTVTIQIGYLKFFPFFKTFLNSTFVYRSAGRDSFLISVPVDGLSEPVSFHFKPSVIDSCTCMNLTKPSRRTQIDTKGYTIH